MLDNIFINMFYAGECYFVCMEGVNAYRNKKNNIEKYLSNHFKEKGIVDMIIKLYDIMEYY